MVFPEAKRVVGHAFTEQDLIIPISRERVEVVRDQLLAVTKIAALLGTASQLGIQLVAGPMEVFFKTPEGRQQGIRRLSITEQTSSFAASLFSEGAETRDPYSILISLPDGHASMLRVSTADRVNPKDVDLWYLYGGLYFQGKINAEGKPAFTVNTFPKEDPVKMLDFTVEPNNELIMTFTQTGRKDKALEDSLKNLWRWVGLLTRTPKIEPSYSYLLDRMRERVDSNLLRVLMVIDSTMEIEELEQLRMDLGRENGLTREQFFAQLLTKSRLKDSWRQWVSRLDNDQVVTVTDYARAKVVFPADSDDTRIDINLSPDMQHLQDQWLANVKTYLGEDKDEMDRITRDDVEQHIRKFSIPWTEHGTQLQALLANGIEFIED